VVRSGSPPRGRSRGRDKKDTDSVKVFKRVYFYLIHYLGGDVSLHDQEVEEVCWSPISEAVKRLSYPTERQTMSKAVALLKNNKGKDSIERRGVKEG